MRLNKLTKKLVAFGLMRSIKIGLALHGIFSLFEPRESKTVSLGQNVGKKTSQFRPDRSLNVPG